MATCTKPLRSGEVSALEYILICLQAGYYVSVEHQRVHMRVHSNTIHLGVDIHSYTIVNPGCTEGAMEWVSSILAASRRFIPAGTPFYPRPIASHHVCRLIGGCDAVLTILIDDVGHTSQRKYLMPTYILRYIRDVLAGVVVEPTSISMDKGVYGILFCWDNGELFVHKATQHRMLEFLNMIFGPICSLGLTTYLCVVGDDTVKKHLDILTKDYDGRFIETTSGSSNGGSHHSNHDHHHYKFPSELLASQAYNVAVRVPGVKFAMTTYSLIY